MLKKPRKMKKVLSQEEENKFKKLARKEMIIFNENYDNINVSMCLSDYVFVRFLTCQKNVFVVEK